MIGAVTAIPVTSHCAFGWYTEVMWVTMFLCIASEDTLGYYTARFTLGSRMLDRDKTEVAGRYSF